MTSCIKKEIAKPITRRQIFDCSKLKEFADDNLKSDEKVIQMGKKHCGKRRNCSLQKSYPNGWKILLEKEKLLVTSNFSFSNCVFKRLVSKGRQKVSFCGNGLKLIQNSSPSNLSVNH